MNEPESVLLTDLAEQLTAVGYAIATSAVPVDVCAELAAMFDQPSRFRSTVDMARHRFGVGSYRYFANPVPAIVSELQHELYRALAPIANDWADKLGADGRFPADLDDFHAECARAGQTEPTSLVLRYTAGGHNRLHQDRYGAVSFPLQATVLLSSTTAFRGGEFVLVENRARQQSVARVVDLKQGDLVVFPNEIRPEASARGHSKVSVRHGVSEIRNGERTALGLIMHNAVG